MNTLLRAALKFHSPMAAQIAKNLVARADERTKEYMSKLGRQTLVDQYHPEGYRERDHGAQSRKRHRN